MKRRVPWIARGPAPAAFLLQTKLAAAALVSRRIQKRNHLGRGRANRRERRGEGPSGHAVGADQPPDAMRLLGRHLLAGLVFDRRWLEQSADEVATARKEGRAKRPLGLWLDILRQKLHSRYCIGERPEDVTKAWFALSIMEPVQEVARLKAPLPLPAATTTDETPMAAGTPHTEQEWAEARGPRRGPLGGRREQARKRGRQAAVGKSSDGGPGARLTIAPGSAAGRLSRPVETCPAPAGASFHGGRPARGIFTRTGLGSWDFGLGRKKAMARLVKRRRPAETPAGPRVNEYGVYTSGIRKIVVIDLPTCRAWIDSGLRPAAQSREAVARVVRLRTRHVSPGQPRAGETGEHALWHEVAGDPADDRGARQMFVARAATSHQQGRCSRGIPRSDCAGQVPRKGHARSRPKFDPAASRRRAIGRPDERQRPHARHLSAMSGEGQNQGPQRRDLPLPAV